eukprot:Skav223108  [mRNA]  locus=scaffold419:726035:734834:+ [translate_table: standard]
MVRKPPVPKVPVSEVQASKSFTPLRDGIRLPEPPRSGRSVSLHLAEDCQEMPQRKRERSLSNGANGSMPLHPFLREMHSSSDGKSLEE